MSLSNSPYLGTSAPMMFGTSLENPGGSYLAASFQDVRLREVRYSFPKQQIKILLLEKIHPNAVKLFESEGFQVESLSKALTEDELFDKISDVHILGIRSKTRVTKRVLENAPRLLAIGCFCIGTEQVDLKTAEVRGVPVFNAPFANTRSVAELCVGEIIALARRFADKTMQMHSGVWDKSADGCIEIRGKTLGIVGYGHIGSQLSVMAEALGMRVIFYDIVPKLPIGNAKAVESLETLLEEADFISLHVPGTPQTENMMSKAQFDLMKKGALFLNASRGKVVRIEDLADAIKSGHLGGAAVDVFPVEPEKNGPGFVTQLQGLPNVILTPHVAGSTLESQGMIGTEVANSLIKLINMGSTMNAVNFPQLELPFGGTGVHRILNVHYNRPGVLRDVNSIFASLDANVVSQMLGTTHDIGYLIVDVERETSQETKKALKELSASIKTRILY